MVHANLWIFADIDQIRDILHHNLEFQSDEMVILLFGSILFFQSCNILIILFLFLFLIFLDISINKSFPLH